MWAIVGISVGIVLAACGNATVLAAATWYSAIVFRGTI